MALFNTKNITKKKSSPIDRHDEKRRRTRSRVCFAEKNEDVVDTLPLSEYTTDEIQSCWFARSEYNSFKRNSLITLSLNRAGGLSPDDPEHTMRGLEVRTRECTESRRFMRYRATAAVLDEQARQKQLGVNDPEAISEAYHCISWHALYDAHTQGMADEQDCIAQQVTSSLDLFALSSPRRTSLSTKRNTVLSKIISIDCEEEQTATSVAMIAGFDSDLWAIATTNASFNLNSFFYDISLGIAVAAA